ncbi:DUF490 domain-containing protein [Pollutimonas nitritireducens]|uniref:DUF490 domain-containing protein n=1 Tax=Pollutimonas nitritireducens TaxID=2045209 RepID=A0A2N4UCN9_9BURK|nr:DUF490 domain-containing protein [Pollutimonas nitritireducens]
MRWLRGILIWLGPVIVVLLLVFSSFLYWVLATPAGSRWAVVTAAEQLGGKVAGVSGSIWNGLYVDDFDAGFPGANVKLGRFHLQARWPELLQRRLHLQALTADSVTLNLAPSPDDTPGQPFSMPTLPFSIVIDRLALDELIVHQDGDPIPMSIRDLDTSITVDQNGGKLVIQSVELGHEQTLATFKGELDVLSLADPWPSQAHLTTQAVGLTADSPLCLNRYLPSLPARKTEGQAGTVIAPAQPGESTPCSLDIDTTIDGSMEALGVVIKGSGQGMSLDADISLAPRAAFPLKAGKVALQLADGSSLHADLEWSSSTDGNAILDRVVGTLRMDKLDVGQLVGDAIPPAVITTSADFDVQLRGHSELVSGNVALNFAEGSRWNKQPLSGELKGTIRNSAIVRGGVPQGPSAGTSGPEVPTPGEPAAASAVQPSAAPLWQSLQLASLNMDLRLGKNHLRAQGGLGSVHTDLKLNMAAPELAAFWPGLTGGASLIGQVAGTPADHKAELTAHYTPDKSKPQQVGSAAAKATLKLEGAWGPGPKELGSIQGWRGKISSLDVDHAGLGLHSDTSTDISFLPGQTAPAWQWQVGNTRMDFVMGARTLFTLNHQGSRGGPGRWETKGAIPSLPVSARLIEDLRKKLDLAAKEKADRGGITIKANKGDDKSEVVFALDWDLKFAGALQGQAHIERVSGDIMVPAEPAFPLGMQAFSLDLDAKATNGATSRLTADLNLKTARMGKVSASAQTLIHATPGGGIVLNPRDAKTVRINATIDDLGWTSLFLDDTMELGGAVQADVQLQSKPDGTWNSSGTISGQKIRLIRIDDGIRLLDGTLSARLQDERLILDSLSFPALLRVKPKEWRTAEWLTTNPEAKDGTLTITGDWNLFDSSGIIDVDLYRYPILQRSDRYAMISGKLRLAIALPKIAINGAVTADAGWFDLDMLGGIPTVDSDVVVMRPGDEKKAPVVPMDISMDLDVDLGRRFYLTGYGLNSGLTGQMHITMRQGKLTGVGALTTRGGAIEVYGQRLQLRRGTVTFQGDITSPVLDIEALRTGLAVEAGVRVAGTAKRPRIDLVSYPAVSEIEKLSWLLLGHAADESGGDVALLFSVGTSFLGSGEPFYRKFGIDEVGLKSGELGSAGSILPAESVVSGLDSGTSDIERKFLSVSKTLTSGITLSIQQALSDTGTVGRASYRLARGLTAELSLGTINGLALVYRWFSRD